MGRWGRWRWVVPPLLMMAASRVAVFAVMWLAGREDGIALGRAVHLWDGGFYLGNAVYGWPDPAADNGPLGLAGYAFYPLYSLLVRAVWAVTPLGFVTSGMVVVLVGALASGVLLWRLVGDHIADAGVALRTVALFAFFPGSYALAMTYSEAVLLPLVMACLLLLHRRQWLWAGVAGALATAARPNGIVVVACCAWAAFSAVRERREWRALAAPALAPLGAVAYHAWIWQATGSPTLWWRMQREIWGERLNVLAEVDRLRYLVSHPTHIMGWTVLAGLVIAVVGVVLLVRDRAPGTWVVWAAGTTLLATSSSLLGMRARFVLTAFPLLVPYAVRLRDAAFSSVLGMCAMGLAIISALITTTTFLVP